MFNKFQNGLRKVNASRHNGITSHYHPEEQEILLDVNFFRLPQGDDAEIHLGEEDLTLHLRIALYPLYMLGIPRNFSFN